MGTLGPLLVASLGPLVHLVVSPCATHSLRMGQAAYRSGVRLQDPDGARGMRTNGPTTTTRRGGHVSPESYATGMVHSPTSAIGIWDRTPWHALPERCRTRCDGPRRPTSSV